MTTISVVCANLFSQTTLAKLKKKPNRAARRALARAIYRQARRPGLVNPQPAGDKSPEVRKPLCNLGVTQKPMRHVYKFHQPKPPKPGTLAARLRIGMVPRWARKADRSLQPRRLAVA